MPAFTTFERIAPQTGYSEPPKKGGPLTVDATKVHQVQQLITDQMNNALIVMAKGESPHPVFGTVAEVQDQLNKAVAEQSGASETVVQLQRIGDALEEISAAIQYSLLKKT